MTNEQIFEAQKMREEGATLQEIGDKFGVSKQRISQIVQRGMYCKKSRYHHSNACIYPNIAHWRKQNRYTMKQFSELSGIKITTLSNLLRGECSTSKKIIDQLLSATGLTYEEAFKTEESEV